MRRHLLGLIAIALLVVGVYFYIRPPEASHLSFVHGSCIKSGTVLLAMWAAYPQLMRLPGWLIATVCGVLMVFVARPQLLLIVLRYGIFLLPILLLLWLLRPRKARTRRKDGDGPV